MREVLTKLREPLKKEDIELRIGTVTAKGFSLLCYKTARVDRKRLDDSGAIWSNRHYNDAHGLVCCEISIWNNNIKEWVSRSDVGVESFTEKEKGSYSDSFKRAGFRWGIGTELYNSPFVWINWKTKPKQNGRGYDVVDFYPSKLEVTRYEVESDIPKLEIQYNKEIIFTSFKKQLQNNNQSQQEKQPIQEQDKNDTAYMWGLKVLAKQFQLTETDYNSFVNEYLNIEYKNLATELKKLGKEGLIIKYEEYLNQRQQEQYQGA